MNQRLIVIAVFLALSSGEVLAGQATTRFEVALSQQLGLKLESRRGPVDVLVIDSVQLPGAN